MNPLLHWLAAGDVRSDGLANEVVRLVRQQPALISDLIEGLDHESDAVRGHTADALEKIGRDRPDLLVGYLPRLLAGSRQDPRPVVRMHLAMIFGHLAVYEEHGDALVDALLAMLPDSSVFTVSWAIVSLCLLARRYPAHRERILLPIAALQRHPSVAIRSKVDKAIPLLSDDGAVFPRGWIKSAHLQALGDPR